jgi:transcriptional regulator GlxA family with amidase domain
VPRTAIVVFPDVQQLDVAGPYEVLRHGGQDVEVVSPDGAAVRSASGLVLGADRRLDAVRGPLDTLLVAGGPGVHAALADAAIVRAVQRLAGRSRRVASVCTGAFLLAEAGLLDGRRATTHWQSCDLLARRYPAVAVQHGPIFVRDGDVWTSAGVTAGLDLALALVEADRGRDAALVIARRLVMYLQRPGGQAQFSVALRAQQAEREPLRDVQAWVHEHLDADLRVDALARRAAMSPRHFARAFAAEVGTTPARFVLEVRVDAARRLLESTGRSVEDVAAACGFGTAEVLRRAFVRTVGVSPRDYRRRFRRESA